jgi:CRP-like cAMP-binding protein
MLKDISLFNGLTDDELSLIERLSCAFDVAPNEYIFRGGDLGHQIYIVQKGLVQISIEHPTHNNELFVLGLIEPNQIFGEFAIFSDFVRSASAIALEPSTLLEFHKSDLLDLFDENNHIGVVVMKNLGALLCERLRAADERLIGSI